MKDTLKRINARILYFRERIAFSEQQITQLTTERATYYNDGGLLPPVLMDQKDRDKIMKMETSAEPCEFCGKVGSVKKSKKSICLECGHQQS